MIRSVVVVVLLKSPSHKKEGGLSLRFDYCYSFVLLSLSLTGEMLILYIDSSFHFLFCIIILKKNISSFFIITPSLGHLYCFFPSLLHYTGLVIGYPSVENRVYSFFTIVYTVFYILYIFPYPYRKT